VIRGSQFAVRDNMTRLLVTSDFHFGSEGAPGNDEACDLEAHSLVEFLEQELDIPPGTLWLVPGDVGEAGKRHDYELALRFFSTTMRSTNRLTKDRLFVVPGNHDFMLRSGNRVEAVRFSEFWAFKQATRDGLRSLPRASNPSMSDLGERTVFPPEGGNVAVAGIASSWNQRSLRGTPLIGDQASLVREFIRSGPKTGALVLLSHHPISPVPVGANRDTIPDGQEILTSLQRRGRSLLVHGHYHESMGWRVQDLAHAGGSVLTVSPPAYFRSRRDANLPPRGFSVVEISDETLRLTQCQSTGRNAAWQIAATRSIPFPAPA
jgi:3',5'-cyclic AMP phosphodiesterase CpdA